MNNEALVYVLFDSIQNSVFEGQILKPLIKQKKENPHQEVYLVSFEKKYPKKEFIQRVKKQGIHPIICKKKLPFLGLFSLYPAKLNLYTFLKTLTYFSIVARGPHAGWISLQAIKNTLCKKITIQARGLLAEEYAYVHKNKNGLFGFIHRLRKKHFERLEKETYHTTATVPLKIEAVSPALKDYLINQYQTPQDIVSVATQDIPPSIAQEQLLEWRSAIRTKLSIQRNTHVYCYNGSAKSWQCPEALIDYFIEQHKKNAQSFLLILSQEKQVFEKLLKRKMIDPSHHYVCTVAHNEIYHYLAASDTGLLFREKNIINWVSRPTKALEYKAAGLKIEHNNTVKMLENF